MKITPKFLSIPPYISACWSQITSLYLRDSLLIVRIADGASIPIPNLTAQEIEAIFDAHSSFTEQNAEPKPVQESAPLHLFRTGAALPAQGGEITAMHFNLENMETFSSALQHSPEQANMPKLPPEVVQKIAAIAKIIAPGEIQNMPKPEPHCNCPHCQIARAIHGLGQEEGEHSVASQKEEEVVTDNDLTFQQWEISQTDDKLFCVSNRLDKMEKYQVYLGHPVGCTCGVSGCEHILAVLKS